MPFNGAICGSLRAGAQREHLYRGSCYQSSNPDRCYDALCMFSLLYFTQEICLEESEGKGHPQSQAVLADILTPSCICVLSPWKLGLGSTWRALNHSPLSQTRGWCCEYGSVRSASPTCCIVSHCGREQPSFLRVRRSFTGLLHFLCEFRGSIVGVRWRLTISATLCCWWFSCSGRAYL